jgi:CubicO group peptidase (beta-lactamase class C family)
MEGRLQAPYPSFKLPRRGHFFAAQSAKKRSFFPELSDLRSPEKERIQLLHAFTMSMGLEWVEATPNNEGNNDEERIHMAPDPCRYVLGLAATAPAGQDFCYNTGALTLLSAIIRKVTGRTLDEFARATLFEPMGITGVEWIRVKGDTDAGGRLRLRPRDMAKIGQLVLAGGRWNDRQVVFEGMDRRLDDTADGRHEPLLLWISLVARPLPAQWA